MKAKVKKAGVVARDAVLDGRELWSRLATNNSEGSSGVNVGSQGEGEGRVR